MEFEQTLEHINHKNTYDLLLNFSSVALAMKECLTSKVHVDDVNGIVSRTSQLLQYFIPDKGFIDYKNQNTILLFCNGDKDLLNAFIGISLKKTIYTKYSGNLKYIGDLLLTDTIENKRYLKNIINSVILRKMGVNYHISNGSNTEKDGSEFIKNMKMLPGFERGSQNPFNLPNYQIPDSHSKVNSNYYFCYEFPFDKFPDFRLNIFHITSMFSYLNNYPNTTAEQIQTLYSFGSS